MAYEEKTISSELVFKGKIFDIRRDKVLAAHEKVTYRDILVHGGASVLIPVKDNGNIVMVRQWRQALESQVLELPAGKVDPGEDFKEAAVRELQEETGYTANTVRYLFQMVPSGGYSSEILKFYLCKDLIAGDTKFDETEDLDLFELSVSELEQMIMSDKILDSKTIAGILFVKNAGII